MPVADTPTTLSPIFELSHRAVAEQAALDPLLATFSGVPGHDGQITDLSPEGAHARAASARALLAELAPMQPTDEADRIAKAFIEERLGAEVLKFDTGRWMADISAIAAPHGDVRSVFDLMSRDGDDAWADLASRLDAVPRAIADIEATYEHGRAHGTVASARQVRAAADQAATWGNAGWFSSLAAEAAADDVAPALLARLQSGAEGANAAYTRFAEYLRGTYLPSATSVDGCGPDLYRVGVREFLGADLDPQEM